MKPAKEERYTRVVQRPPFEPDHGTAEQIREAVKAVVLERKKAQIS